MSDSSNTTNNDQNLNNITNPQTSATPEINIPQKVITKIPDPNVPSEPNTSTPQDKPKEKRKYTKDPNKKYGNPLWKKGKKPELKAKSGKIEIVKNDKKESVKHTNVNSKYPDAQNKKPNKSMFYVGLGLGLIAGGIGLYFLIKKIREHIKSNKEVEALKYIASELEKEQNQKSLNDQFLEDCK